MRTIVVQIGQLSLFLCACMLLNPGAAAQSEDQNWASCNAESDPDRVISGCTLLLESRTLPSVPIAIAFVNRGNAYYAQGQYDRAIQDFNMAILHNAAYARAFYERGLAYFSKRQYDRAIQDYDQAIRLNPSNAIFFDSRGLAYSKRAQYDRAIEDYDHAIRLDPGSAAFYNRGNAYYKKGKYNRAIQDYNQAIRRNPSNTQAFNNRGNTYLNKGQYDRAIELSPAYASAFYNRGRAKRALGDKPGAEADFARAQQLDPTLKLPSD